MTDVLAAENKALVRRLPSSSRIVRTSSPEAREFQRRFFDRYLKGLDNHWERTPRVRLETRTARTAYKVRAEPQWPLDSVRRESWYLDAATRQLTIERADEAALSYEPARTGADGRARLMRRFDRETELTGSMTLKVWVSTSDGDDLDLFVVLRKWDTAGREVPFYGYNGFDQDGVAKGWLRVSHRELDCARSRLGQPWHAHRRRQPVRSGDIVPVEIEILASSTLFEEGSSLSVDILGRDADRYPAFRHGHTVNRGTHTIHTGGRFDSHLLAPVVRTDARRS